MTVALVLSHPATMPGYKNSADLDEVHSLSRYCFLVCISYCFTVIRSCTRKKKIMSFLSVSSVLHYSRGFPDFPFPGFQGHYRIHMDPSQGNPPMDTFKDLYPSRVQNKEMMQ